MDKKYKKNYEFFHILYKYQCIILFFQKIQTVDTKIEEGILSKTESYFLKARKLCKQTIMATEYPNLVQCLDSFTSDIIETSLHLQNSEVSRF